MRTYDLQPLRSVANLRGEKKSENMVSEVYKVQKMRYEGHRARLYTIKAGGS